MENVGENITSSNASWTFSGKVPEVFDAHVKRSVPFYEEGHDLILKASDFFISKDSTIYDLGCSTGSLLTKLNARHDKGQWVGVDSVDDMIQFARDNNNSSDISYVCSDLNDFEFIKKADLIVSYYTMQFISPRHRQDLINQIYESLNWGGAFIIFEKIRAPDARFQDILTSLYTDYKLDQNYTPSEIISKSKSLKGVLEPFSNAGNMGLYQRAGFIDIMPIFRYLCFEGTLLIK